MKQKDLILVVVMVFIGAAVAFTISHFVFSSPKYRQQTAEVVDVITPEFPQPSTKYFNVRSLNLTDHQQEKTDSPSQQEDVTTP